MQCVCFQKIFCDQELIKDDITAMKVIGTALNKSNSAWIIFAKLAWTLISCPDFSFILGNRNFFSSLIQSGANSHVFGAKDERLSLL